MNAKPYRKPSEAVNSERGYTYYRSDKVDVCDRCGEVSDRYQVFDSLKPTYQIFGLVKLCSSCGDHANNFVNYYGKKKKEDVARLRNYLTSGFVSGYFRDKDFSSLMNGGYYAK